MTDIYHSGIKGQKKGVRRYQYANGTYTREGNLRYRPDKVRGYDDDRAASTVIKLAVGGEMALIGAKALSKSSNMPSISSLLNTTISSLHGTHQITIGQKIVAAAMAHPTLTAMALPAAAIGTGALLGYAIMNRREIERWLEDTDFNKIANNVVAAGSSAAGIAMSAISGNPVPAMVGLGAGAMVKMRNRRDY